MSEEQDPKPRERQIKMVKFQKWCADCDRPLQSCKCDLPPEQPCTNCGDK